MPRQPTELWDYVSVRIPEMLRREVKLRCLQSGIPMMEFVTAAIVEKLDGEERRERRIRRSQGR